MRSGAESHPSGGGLVSPAILCFALCMLLLSVGSVLRWSGGFPPGLYDITTLSFVLFPVVGLVIASRRSGNRVGWLCLVIGLAWGIESFMWGVGLYGLANPGTIAIPEAWAAIGNPFWVPGVFLIPTYLVLFFPDGLLPSPRWRPVARLVGVTLSAVFVATFLQPETTGYGHPTLSNPFHPSGAIGDALVLVVESGVVFALLLGCVIACVASVIVRFRRSTGIEREQLKWLVSAAALAAGAFLPSVVLEEVYGDVLPLAAGLTLSLIPLAIGIAITRHRLYDIDRIISRTLSYSLVVALLASLYLLMVRWLSSLLPGDSAFAVAGSTLLVAAAFNPVRRRVLRWIDRRFNRAHYEANNVVEHFSKSLQGRDDASRIAADWIDVVTQTLEPASVAVWLRDGPTQPIRQRELVRPDSVDRAWAEKTERVGLRPGV